MHDVIVVGAGPAGIAAAATAAAAGLDVLLLDSAPQPGGNIWRHTNRADLPDEARTWLARLDRSGAHVRTGATLVDVQRASHGFAVQLAFESQPAPESQKEARVVHARRVVIATGARELFLPFPGWTLPGVLGVGGAQALLKSGADFSGRRIVVAGSGPLLLPVSAALSQAGAEVTHILEQAPTMRVALFALGLWRSPGRIAQAAAYRRAARDAAYMTDAWVTAAHASAGGGRLQRVTVKRGRGREPVHVACDFLCIGYGLVPAREVAELLGCRVLDGFVAVDAQQRTSIEAVYCAGEPTGIAGMEAAVLEGVAAGEACVADHGATSRDDALPLEDAGRRRASPAVRRQRAFGARMQAAFATRTEVLDLPQPDTIICRCEDVTRLQVENCMSAREAKLHTRAGMGPCQGRVCGPALAQLFGWNETSVRPPLFPVSVAALLENHTSAEAERSQ